MLSEFPYSCNYNDPLFAELYDQSVTDSEDVHLIRKLIGESEPLYILECFSGTGRILIPLVEDGHTMVGIELAHAMHSRAMSKIKKLSPEKRSRVTLKVQDVLKGNWGKNYDVILMGANAFYELPSAEAQEKCIKLASKALASGGMLFLDNDDQKKPLTKGAVGESWSVFKGTGTNGSYGEASARIIDVDVEKQVLFIQRQWYTRRYDGTENWTKYRARKHPVSSNEIEAWLHKYDFKIVRKFGDKLGNPYTQNAERAIFWAQITN